MIEIEYKFIVPDPLSLMEKLGGRKPEIAYVKDEVFGLKKLPKVRKRTTVHSNRTVVNFERITPILDKNTNKKLEETIVSIPEGYVCENSYDKIRYIYARGDCVITIDFYCFGVFCEIEGDEKVIREVAKQLGFNVKDNLTKNIDTLFCDWYGKNPPLHWGFKK